MSKVTAVTDAQGQIVVIGHGHLSEATAKKSGLKGAQGGLWALPGQQLHELDVPENVEASRASGNSMTRSARTCGRSLSFQRAERDRDMIPLKVARAGKKLHGPALKMTRAGYLIPIHFIEDGTST